MSRSPWVQWEVRSYVVTRGADGRPVQLAVIVLSCRQLASIKRQTAASLTISWFHNDGPHRHVCSVGKVKVIFIRRSQQETTRRASKGVRAELCVSDGAGT